MPTSRIWTPVIGWMAATATALGLALAVPHESDLLGRLPQLTAKRVDQRHVQLPQELPAARTLALVVFRSNQKAEVQSWIDGLGLRQTATISWLKLPVLPDPGDEKERRRLEQSLLARQTVDPDRLIAVFTDRDAFVRSAGLSGAEHASVLVLDRHGNVLARAEGAYDEHKAEALRETVLAQND